MDVSLRSRTVSADQKFTLNTEQPLETMCSSNITNSTPDETSALSSNVDLYCKHNCFRKILKPDSLHDDAISSQSFTSSPSSTSSLSSSTSTTAKSLGNSSCSLLPNSFLPCQDTPFSNIIQFVFSTKEISARVFLDLVSHISRRKTRHFNITNILLTMILLTLSLNICHTESRSTGVCRGIPCANGGRLLVSNSIWGNCRCRCRSGFVGPYCQYQTARKRSGNSRSGGNRRLSRSQTMETIRLRLLALSQSLDDYENQDSENTGNTATNVDAEILQESRAVRQNEASIDSNSVFRSRRSWRARNYRT